MAVTPPLPESEVRALVRRVVEGVLAENIEHTERSERSAGSPGREHTERSERSAGSPGREHTERSERSAGSPGREHTERSERSAGSPGREHTERSERSAGSPGGDNIAIGADHGGFKLKEELAVKLRVADHEVVDCGTDSAEPVDYPDIAHAVARKVADGSCRWGIIVDGAGIGSAMVANKVPGVRAAACYDLSTARNSREHNHANVLTLGAGLTGAGLAWQIVQEWLSVPWGPDRHARRVDMIDEIEQSYR